MGSPVLSLLPSTAELGEPSQCLLSSTINLTIRINYEEKKVLQNIRAHDRGRPKEENITALWLITFMACCSYAR